jgi:hypothetical protein
MNQKLFVILLFSALVFSCQKRHEESLTTDKRLSDIQKMGESITDLDFGFYGVNRDSLEWQLVIGASGKFRIQARPVTTIKFDHQNNPVLPLNGDKWTKEKDRLIVVFNDFPKADVEEIFRGNSNDDVAIIDDNTLSVREDIQEIVINNTTCGKKGAR